MKIAILGFDTEGRATYEYFSGLGHTITVHDQNTEVNVPTGVASVLGENYLDNLEQYDLVIRTAGLPPRKILEKNPMVASKISTQVNEFLKASPTTNIIGVTGTKGKGTTSTLITEMLQAAGKDVYLGGNIGVPPFTFLNKLTKDSWVILELSSFQLIDLKMSPHIAVCLMVVPEHLDCHPDVEEYMTAKSQLFAHQTPGDIAIYFAENSNSAAIADASPGLKLPYYQPPGAHIVDGSITISEKTICQTDELRLLGSHNWQNVCAAITAVWQVTQNISAMRTVLTNFSGLEHRLEFVQTIAGAKYYDDSFGTTPETAIVAIQAFEAPKVVILGGSDKGASYDILAEVVATSNIRKVLLIGEQANRIQQALDGIGFNNYMAGGNSMTEIVETARNIAQSGDVVLLSTGCASFDMFKNYKDRALQFRQAVQALA
jgi:UDP-N-acetylmuramoylalanine--D-glutamate ligase